MELLAPAGNLDCFISAVSAGADAVYLGMTSLNARSSASNFTEQELSKAIDYANKHNVKVYLALNTDITSREIGLATRIMLFARSVGVSAFIIKEPALISLWHTMVANDWQDGGSIPELHLSTQAAITNIEGAMEAKSQGIARVVLARELSLNEISLIKKNAKLEIEVFAQGAMCYSISGRCLLSSWGGGRSGNRGLCTSTCRVPWKVNNIDMGTPLSMCDLSTIDRLQELKDAGVDVLKIEGRLKKPDWVFSVVKLYKQALLLCDNNEPNINIISSLKDSASRLAAYAGRGVTSGYFDENYSNLTSIATRKPAVEKHYEKGNYLPTTSFATEEDNNSKNCGYDLSVNITSDGIICLCSFSEKKIECKLPLTVVKRKNKAISVGEFFESLRKYDMQGIYLEHATTNYSDFLIPPRNVNHLVDSIRKFIRQELKYKQKDTLYDIKLSSTLDKLVKKKSNNSLNKYRLGSRITCLRLSRKNLMYFSTNYLSKYQLIFENMNINDLEDIKQKGFFIDKIIVSLPCLYFPNESSALNSLCAYCSENNLEVEANCWGGIKLCKEHKINFHIGPGLSILNHISSYHWYMVGAKSASISLEADSKQIEDLSLLSYLPLSLTVYSYPVLAYTRIPCEQLLSGNYKSYEGDIWEDRRGIKFTSEKTSSFTALRSLTPFNLSNLNNPKILVSSIVADLTGSNTPEQDLNNILNKRQFTNSTFNYSRGLK